jgi:hypothetical protein
MNTHDKIDLPPLPEWLQEQAPDTKYPVSTIVTAMKQYAKVSIEAVRQQRGEPISWLVAFRRNPGAAVDHLFVLRREDAERQVRPDLIASVTPLYRHPQPAEPVKVPSDGELIELSVGRIDSAPDGEVIDFARALLAHYGGK